MPHEIESLAAFSAAPSLDGAVVCGVDFHGATDRILAQDPAGCIFLGCALDAPALGYVCRAGALVFPRLPKLPYRPYRGALYSPAELMAGYRRGAPQSFADATLDAEIYGNYCASKRRRSTLDALGQRLHDLAIDDALAGHLAEALGADGPRRPVGIMGGHALSRTDPRYRDVVTLAWALTRAGYYVATGGGPGAMEAANLGAWLSTRPTLDLDAALAELAPAPGFRDPAWFDTAYQLIERFQHADFAPGQSLAIPTWFYGHEPSNLFATHIAKYFSNSLREDGLLAVATHGIVFTPGSAGTVQEVFQDAAQNHYGTCRLISPMVLLDRAYWTEHLPVLPLLRALAADHPYRDLIHITDTVQDALAFIQAHPPLPAP